MRVSEPMKTSLKDGTEFNELQFHIVNWKSERRKYTLNYLHHLKVSVKLPGHLTFL